MNDIAISCKNITKIYPMYDNPKDRFKEALHPFRKIYHKEFYALSDINFDIHKGETVGIIGQNGAGKSTLLKIITGVLTPTSGTKEINGVVSSILELGTGFNPELTGIENIYINCSLMGLSNAQTDDKLDKIISFADIGEHINQPLRGYSSGMFARLAMAVAINVDPDILIVDEALAVGDINFQAKCMTAMKRIQSKGTTILFVSHDISSVKSLCERCIYLKDGVVHAVGEAGDIAELYIKEMRELQNDTPKSAVDDFRSTEVLNVIEKQSHNVGISAVESSKKQKKFNEAVKDFRYGTGEAKVQFVEITDSNDIVINEVAFNQEIKIKIYFESFSETKLTVAFQLFDDKKINITSGSLQHSGERLIYVQDGEKYMVEYLLKLPLQKNSYALQVMLADPINHESNVSYLDVVPNACVFGITRRPEHTLWSKVDLFPSVSVSKL